jgi:glycosyltransferase involved in cell wall biosynthesis
MSGGSPQVRPRVPGPDPGATSPLVSVVIPVFNGERTIAATLASVLVQTHRELEVIVVDDGSTDATLQIVAEAGDERVRIVRQARRGVSSSRNRGVAEARGEYVAFIDADDLWTAGKLESQVAALRENPAAAVAYCWTDYVDPDGRAVGRAERVTHQGWVRQALLRRFFLESASNAMVRRSALLAAGGFDERRSRGEDWDLFLRIAEVHPFVLVREVGLLYRTGGASLTADVAATERECLEVIREAYARSPAAERRFQRHAVAGLYNYLGFRALGDMPDRRDALRAARYLARSVTTEPRFALNQASSTGLLLLKTLLFLLLPAPLARRVVIRYRGLRTDAAGSP